MKSILDPSFRYVPSASTDLRKTFSRIRREMQRTGAQDVRSDASVAPRVLVFSRSKEIGTPGRGLEDQSASGSRIANRDRPATINEPWCPSIMARGSVNPTVTGGGLESNPAAEWPFG
jgi:hypothetical protein